MIEQLTDRVEAARIAIGSSREAIHAAGGAAPRYELFHAANSICSQKVRCVLAQHRLAWISHPINMFEGQTYLPDYVRLRMIGCERLGGALVSRHNGSTSAAAGCDGAVVPTLVDWATGEVVVDSKLICIHLDDGMAVANRLRPPSLADAIDAELAIVDDMPNYQMLMGRRPGSSENGATKNDVGGSFSQRKVAWCDRYLDAVAEEPVLVAAYTAKRAKEASAARDLFSPEAMTLAYDHVDAALQELERKLARDEGPWLFGGALTLADLFWSIELLRMKNMGLASGWEAGRLPHVERFAAAGEALPAIRAAIIDWPGAMF